MQEILIGAHTSAAGGAYNALLEGKEIGATTIQLFTSNQKRWDSKPFTPEAIQLWNKTLAETQLKKIMSHDSYLINLGSPNPENLIKSRASFREETSRCLQLGISFLNFHPGSALDETPEKCLDKIAESILLVEDLVAESPLCLVLENTAGQGSSVGYRFEHLAYIIGKVKARVPIGVCMDTCHAFVAGYDIRTAEGWDTVLKEFDSIVGLKYLKAFHVNDSMKGLGTKVDRHQLIGKGEIGLESFRVLMNDLRTRYIPKYLETPGGPSEWKTEIELLKNMIK